MLLGQWHSGYYRQQRSDLNGILRPLELRMVSRSCKLSRRLPREDAKSYTALSSSLILSPQLGHYVVSFSVVGLSPLQVYRFGPIVLHPSCYRHTDDAAYLSTLRWRLPPRVRSPKSSYPPPFAIRLEATMPSTIPARLHAETRSQYTTTKTLRLQIRPET